DVPFFKELGAVADEQIVGLLDDEIAEPIVKAEEQVITPVIDIDEDIAMLFSDDDFEDDDSKGFDEEEVWEVNGEWLMVPVTPLSMPVVPPQSVYEVGGPSTADAVEGQSFPLPASVLYVPSSVIEDLCTRLGNLKYGNGQLVKKVQVMVSQMVQTEDELEHIGAHAAVQQRDLQIQQLHTMVSKMSSRDSTLMQCILGMDMRLSDLERRPPGPQ
nr:hypothetical protein [Tanacetum cinerariifolium]